MGPRRYADIAMPARFVLEVRDQAGDWIDWGLLSAADFCRLDDGSYLCSGHGGSPLYLRCVRQEGDVIEVIDGAGARHSYRLVPFPNERYQL